MGGAHQRAGVLRHVRPVPLQADLELFRRLGLVRCERPLSLELPVGLMARLKL